MNQFGHHFRLSIWGESHGPMVGITIDGVRPGIALAEEDFAADLARRRGGSTPGATPRREPDIPQIVSGLYRGHTTGAPLTLLFANTNTRSQDYANVARHFRPSHADTVAYYKYGGFNDPRGGGHFSARLTVALVAAGVVAKKMLPEGVCFTTRLTEIGGCDDPQRFDEVLRHAAAELDSVGGIVECRVQGSSPSRPSRAWSSVADSQARACAARRTTTLSSTPREPPPRTTPEASTAALRTATNWSCARR